MWTALIATLLMQSASPAYGVACRADPDTGEVDVTVARVGDDGTLMAPASRHDRKWEPLGLEGRPEAAGLDWYEAGDPIVRDGVRYLPGPDTWSPGAAVNRYLRHAGLHEGAPLFSLWPGGDIDLAVLVRQEGCVFRTYERESGSAP